MGTAPERTMTALTATLALEALEAAGVDPADYPLCTLRTAGFSDSDAPSFYLENSENDDYAINPSELAGLLADYSSTGLPFILTVWPVNPG